MRSELCVIFALLLCVPLSVSVHLTLSVRVSRAQHHFVVTCSIFCEILVIRCNVLPAKAPSGIKATSQDLTFKAVLTS